MRNCVGNLKYDGINFRNSKSDRLIILEFQNMTELFLEIQNINAELF